MGRGYFITFEGGEGAGKTTQIRALETRLAQTGREIIRTREPGGTPEAEKIRNLLVQRDGGEWTPTAEILLFFAARAQHVETLIKPALAAGKIVLCDRFTDSTRAYQAFAHGVDRARIEVINTAALGDFAPDLTFIFDIDPRVGLRRSAHRMAESSPGHEQTEDRFERMDLLFHDRLREGYLTIAGEEPGRCVVVNADNPVDDIARKLWITLEQKGVIGHDE